MSSTLLVGQSQFQRPGWAARVSPGVVWGGKWVKATLRLPHVSFISSVSWAGKHLRGGICDIILSGWMFFNDYAISFGVKPGKRLKKARRFLFVLRKAFHFCNQQAWRSSDLLHVFNRLIVSCICRIILMMKMLAHWLCRQPKLRCVGEACCMPYVAALGCAGDAHQIL